MNKKESKQSITSRIFEILAKNSPLEDSTEELENLKGEQNEK